MVEKVRKGEGPFGNSYKCFYGDCFKVIYKKIQDTSIDLILTDIPYNISKENNFKTMKDRKGRNGIDFGYWDKGFEEEQLFVLSSKLKDTGSLVIFHSFEQYAKLQNIFKDSLIFKDKIIWEKTNPMPRNRDRRYVNNIEMASWFVKSNKTWTFNRQSTKYDGCVLRYPSESGGGFKRYHPCQKNVDMLSELILRHSNTGDIVLDPFMGGGSVGVACKALNRKFIGIEKEERYFDIAVDRIVGLSKQI